MINNPKSVLGYRTNLSFTIGLHNKDSALLKLIEGYFEGYGGISKLGAESSQYRVTSVEGLKLVIDHFDTYPLRTQKKADYLLFKQAYELVAKKEHLSLEGLNKILSLRASMNLGLPENLKNTFNVVQAPRPEVLVEEIPNPYWLSGFVCGDGCFMVSVSKSLSTKSGFSVRLYFSISQDLRDSVLMSKLADYLSCGNWHIKEGKSYGEFVVSKFTDIESKIIPFFDKYPIYGDKRLDFESFKQAASTIVSKGHLTAEGLEEINSIKGSMNKERYPKG